MYNDIKSEEMEERKGVGVQTAVFCELPVVLRCEHTEGDGDKAVFNIPFYPLSLGATVIVGEMLGVMGLDTSEVSPERVLEAVSENRKTAVKVLRVWMEGLSGRSAVIAALTGKRVGMITKEDKDEAVKRERCDRWSVNIALRADYSGPCPSEVLSVLTVEELAELLCSLLVMFGGTDETRAALERERKRLGEAMSVRDDKDVLTFGGLTIYGGIIDRLAERYHWGWEEIVWRRSYDNIMLLMDDMQQTMLLTEEDKRRMPLSVRVTKTTAPRVDCKD